MRKRGGDTNREQQTRVVSSIFAIFRANPDHFPSAVKSTPRPFRFVPSVIATDALSEDGVRSVGGRNVAPTDAPKLMVQFGFGGPDIERPKRASKSAKRTSAFSTQADNDSGNLAKFTVHRCAPMHFPLDRVAAISAGLFDCTKTTEDSFCHGRRTEIAAASL